MQADAACMSQKEKSEDAVRECCVNMLAAEQCLVFAVAGMSVDASSPVKPLILTGEERKIIVT